MMHVTRREFVSAGTESRLHCRWMDGWMCHSHEELQLFFTFARLNAEAVSISYWLISLCVILNKGVREQLLQEDNMSSIQY